MSFEPGTANPGYAWGQLRRALDAAVSSDDPAVRARAARKVGQWQAVLTGMGDGDLEIGSRTPVSEAPSWVTLEVVHGGFATGRLLAEQPLDDTETVRLAGLVRLPARTDRERLNLWSLSDAGQAELLAALEDGRYAVDLPEHAALPAVVLLLACGHSEPALDLLAQLRPMMHRLRLTPRLLAEPESSSALVHLERVGDVRRQLQEATTPAQVLAMNATCALWNPLHDELLALWADTVEEDLPHLVRAQGGDTVAGGWPCRRFPPDWAVRRAQLLERYERAAGEAVSPTRHLHRRGSTRRLVEALRACPQDSSALTGRDVGWVRRVLADALGAAGAPDSLQRSSLRAQQADMAARPTRRAVAQVLADRLQAYPADGGLPDLGPVSAGIAPGELPGSTRPQPVPRSLLLKVRRAWEATVAQLVAAGVISSGDVLARVLPQVTAQHLASGITDPVAARLHARSYAAFRRRRSLLLLDLQHQVRVGELPWVAALEAFRGRDTSTGATAAALREVVVLALTAFPHAILPNPLVRELGALATRAGLQLPLVEEVAADIFTGTFTVKWRTAAEVTSRTLDGTLYARYYDLPPATDWQQAAGRPRSLRQRLRGVREVTAEDFAELCRRRAGEAGGPGAAWSTAGNGTVLEQSQILTTHNLAVLVDALALRPQLDELAPALAEQVLHRIIRSWQRLPSEWHARLIAVKNVAYAWRQAVFLLSACSSSEQRRLLATFTQQVQARATGLAPVARGLELVLDGQRFDATGQEAGGTGRRLLGWSVGPHWLLQHAAPGPRGG